MSDPASTLAAHLGHLQHPSGAMVAIPGFDRHAAHHPELAEAHGKLAELIAQAAIHTLTTAGYHILTTEQLHDHAQQLADDMTAAPTQALVSCDRCRTNVFRLTNIADSASHTNIATLAHALSTHVETCR